MKHNLITAREFKILSDSLHSIIGKDITHDVTENIYVELGTRRARTSIEIAQILENGSKGHLRPTFLGIDCDPEAHKYWQSRVGDKKFANISCQFYLGTTQKASESCGNVVWVFIDACHCFDCATWDIENWGKKVLPGGHLIIHDTSPRRDNYSGLFQHNHTRTFGVSRAVKESGYLTQGWICLAYLDDTNGIMVFERM